ncbi:hypothetical protein AB1285_18725 [Microbacterium sp. NRRL B-14842]|uniref:hypothetical protein n=1 Tax=Microbacterium sp. NRRL B-14842 TaxID=3162881 RepID=UPI003D2BE53A
MISGDGFFVVRSGGETLYTRNGGFTFDASGRLVGAGGALVQGWTARNGAIVPGQGIGDINPPGRRPQPRPRPPPPRAPRATCPPAPRSARRSCATSRRTAPTAPP